MVIVNVSIVVSGLGVEASVVPVGPAVVNVQKSNLSVQTSKNEDTYLLYSKINLKARANQRSVYISYIKIRIVLAVRYTLHC